MYIVVSKLHKYLFCMHTAKNNLRWVTSASLKSLEVGRGGGNTRLLATHRKSGKALMNFFATQCSQICHPAAVLHGGDGKLLGKQQRPTKPTRLTARNNTESERQRH